MGILNDPLTYAAIYLLMMVIGGRKTAWACMDVHCRSDAIDRIAAVAYFLLSPLIMLYLAFVFSCVGIAIAIYYITLWPFYHIVIVPISNALMPEKFVKEEEEYPTKPYIPQSAVDRARARPN